MTEHVRRASRLVEVERLLRRHPSGLTSRELARETGYSPRTIQRDIAVLESELGVPIVLEGHRYRVMEGTHPLSPVRFTLHEARAIFIATRLFLRYSDEWDPDAVSALDKLADALPGPVSTHIRSVADELRTRPQDRQRSDVLRVITEAWGSSRTVRIRYRSMAHGTEAQETDLDPYLIEPNANATYVVGYSHRHGEVRTFKLERLEHAENTGRIFVPRDVRDIVERLAASWGIVIGDGEDVTQVILEFAPRVAKRVSETRWHASQRLTWLDGGSVRLEFQLPTLVEFVPWVRSWGPDVTVVAPDSLRDEIARSLAEAFRHYSA